MYLTVTKVYPTRVRALGVGLGYSASRFGGLASPFFAQVKLTNLILVLNIKYSEMYVSNKYGVQGVEYTQYNWLCSIYAINKQ